MPVESHGKDTSSADVTNNITDFNLKVVECEKDNHLLDHRPRESLTNSSANNPKLLKKKATSIFLEPIEEED